MGILKLWAELTAFGAGYTGGRFRRHVRVYVMMWIKFWDPRYFLREMHRNFNLRPIRGAPPIGRGYGRQPLP